MQKIKFIFSLLITVALVYGLGNSWQKGKIPVLGSLFSPFEGFWCNAESVAPKVPAVMEFDELKNPVKVVYDEQMVPHIFAQNTNDAVYVQGYVQAKMRLFQMDFITRAAGGRLSELVGAGEEDKVLKFDMSQRRIGLLAAAEQNVELWKQNPELWSIMQNYSNGINAYIGSINYKDYPLEYKLLGAKPEYWNPLKTALLMKFMAQDLIDYEADIESTNTLSQIGKEEFKFLFPEYFSEQKPVIPDSVWNFTPAAVKTPDTLPFASNMKGAAQLPVEKSEEEGKGSNNWVVSAQRTANKASLLCNDPHLGLTFPSIWFQIHLVTPDYNVYGVTLPGAPGVIIGFNENISWGVTNVSHDVKDWYKITWKDATRKQYWFEGAWKNAEMRVETVNSKDGKVLTDTIRYTFWGSAPSNDKNHQDMAMRWLAHDTGNDALTFLMLNKAKNYDDFVKALGNYTAPAQNFVFADRLGNIALWVNGKLPLRFPQQGRFVMDGSREDAAWQGFIPHDQLPHSYNPTQGYLTSANQHSVSPAYPYYYLGKFEKYRSRYINRKLATLNNATVQDMMDLQFDTYSLKAEDFMPLYLSQINKTALTADNSAWLEMLEKWNFKYDKSSQEAILFQEWHKKIVALTYDEFDSLRTANIPILYPDEMQFKAMLKNDAANKYFDMKKTPMVETAKDIVTMAWLQVCDELKEAINKDAKYKEWNYHEVHAVRHILPTLKAFSHIPIDAGGDKSAPNALGTNILASGRKTSGPSWRMIVEMGNTIKAYGIYPGGQSGNPGSFFYDNLLPLWETGKYIELNFPKTPEELSKPLAVQEFK